MSRRLVGGLRAVVLGAVFGVLMVATFFGAWKMTEQSIQVMAWMWAVTP